MTPMTTQRRFGIILTVLMIVALTGFFVGCDSDDGPTVTPPSGGGGGEPAPGVSSDPDGESYKVPIGQTLPIEGRVLGGSPVVGMGQLM